MSRQLAVQVESVALFAQTVTSEITFFAACVLERLDALHDQFDLDYWLSLNHFLRELASGAENAILEVTDLVTAASAMASRPSRVEFIKALVAAIDENSGRNYGQLPK
ncbi:hypothetical protein L0Y47_19025 [Ectopseudomonas composti]